MLNIVKSWDRVMITNIVECHNLFLTPGNTGYDNMLQGLRVPTCSV